MEIVYLINPSSIKDITNISDNLSDKYIRSALRESQDIGLNQILGTRLLDKLYTLVSTGRIKDAENAKYKRLLDSHIGYYLAYETITNVVVIASVKIDNAGAVTSDADKTNSLDLKDVFKIENYYRQKSDFYKARLQAYLRMEHDNFPELEYEDAYNTLAEIETAYTSSIFLGGKRGKKPYRPCYGTCGHISPEKPDTPDTPEKPYYQVIYMVDGNVYDYESYQEGERIIPAIAPEKDGYTFQYWEGLPEYMPANDITVSAVYQEIPSGVQGYYTLRYRVADWREDGDIHFDNMAYIPEPFEWLQCVEREYNPETREGWAKLTHPSLTADSEIRFQKFPGYDALFMLDLSDFNNAYMTDGMFAENTTLREFYPPKGLIGMDGYDFYNCQYLETVNFATADGYKEYQPYSYPATGAFCYCVSLKSILADNQPHMYSDNGNLYNSSDELMHARYGEVTIKEGCTCIKSESLKGRGLGTLTIPASVRKIEGYSISENQSLTDVYFTGTMQDWANIEKDDVNTIFAYTNVTVIHCSDGDCAVDYTGEEQAEYKVDIFIEWDYIETRWFKVGERIELPEPPIREGYVFTSWNAIIPVGEWFDMPEYMPNYNFEVHASYTEAKQAYILTYWNGNEGFKGDEVLSRVTLNEGVAIDYFQPPVKEGFTHRHWAYHRDEGVVGNAETEMPNMPSHDLDVWTWYEFNSYNVYYTLYDENGDVCLEDYITYRYTDYITPYLPDVPEGYTFVWDNEPVTMPAHDVTVTGRLIKSEQ